MSAEPVLRTARLLLEPMALGHLAEHIAASGREEDAIRDTRSADAHWREHGFGPWTIRDARDGAFLGGAEIHFAGEGIDGIAADELEAGWWVAEPRRGEGIATEAMRAAIDDLWLRVGAERLAAYISGDNEPSRRVAAKLGFTVRGTGRGRGGEEMTVYEVSRCSAAPPRSR